MEETRCGEVRPLVCVLPTPLTLLTYSSTALGQLPSWLHRHTAPGKQPKHPGLVLDYHHLQLFLQAMHALGKTGYMEPFLSLVFSYPGQKVEAVHQSCTML